MNAKRENHLEQREAQARRGLDHAARRWPTNPNTYYVILVLVLVLLLVLLIAVF